MRALACSLVCRNNATINNRLHMIMQRRNGNIVIIVAVIGVVVAINIIIIIVIIFIFNIITMIIITIIAVVIRIPIIIYLLAFAESAKRNQRNVKPPGKRVAIQEFTMCDIV